MDQQELVEANKRLLERRGSLKPTTENTESPNTKLFSRVLSKLDTDKDRPPEEAIVLPSRAKINLRWAGVSPKYSECSFGNFKGNERLVDDLRKIKGSVFLTGKTGCGKTHLATAMLAEAEVDSSTDAFFITVPEMLMKIRSSFSGTSGETEEELVKRFSDYQILVLDDLGSEKTTEYSITTLFLILDRRDRWNRRTIVTSNLSLKEIEDTLGARIASRLAAMQAIKINMPDYRKN